MLDVWAEPPCDHDEALHSYDIMRDELRCLCGAIGGPTSGWHRSGDAIDKREYALAHIHELVGWFDKAAVRDVLERHFAVTPNGQ